MLKKMSVFFSIIVMSCLALSCQKTDHDLWRINHHKKINNLVIQSALSENQTHPYVVSKNSNGTSYTSRALSQGDVVGVYNYFYPLQTTSKKSFLNIKYVVVNFTSDKSIESGEVSPDSLHTTEVWKFIDESTCPVITNLNTNTRVTAVRNISLAPDNKSVRVQLFTGSTVGIPGEIAFDDVTPIETECENNQFNPIMKVSDQDTFYKPYQVGVDPSYSQAPKTFFNQSIRKIKVTPIMDPDWQVAVDHIVQFITDAGCLGAHDPSVRSGCADNKGVAGMVWISRYNQKNNPPGSLSTYMLFDPLSPAFNKIAHDQGYTLEVPQSVRDIDMIATTNATNPLLGLTIVIGYAYNYALKLDDLNTGDIYTKHAPSLKLSLVAPYSFIKLDQSPWQYAYQMNSSYVWMNNILTTYDTTYFPTEKIVVPPIISLQKMLMGPSAYVCSGADVPFNERCHMMTADNIPLVDPAIVPAEFKKITRGANEYSYGGQNRAHDFQGTYNFARPEPLQNFVNFFSPNLNSNSLVGFRSISTSLNSNNNLGLKIFSPDPKFTGRTSKISSIPKTFSSQYYFFDQVKDIPSGSMTFDISEPQVKLMYGSKPQQPDQVYIMFYSKDIDQMRTEGQSQTGGGVYVCVASYFTNGVGNNIGRINFSDCDKERPFASQNNPYPTGYKIILASDITNNGTYLTTPKKVTMTQTPAGDMILDYVAANQGIFTLNLTEKTGDDMKNWFRYSVGRNAECHMVLKNTQNDEGFWGKTSKFAGSTLLTVALDLALPEGAIFVEIGLDFFEDFVLESGDAKKLTISDLMNTNCSAK